MKYSLVFSIIVGIAVFATLVANVLSSLVAPFFVGPFMLSGGFFTFPLLYVASDILSKVYGYQASRRVAWIAMGANVLMILFIELAWSLLPGAKEPLAPLHITAAVVTVAGLVAGQIGDWGNDVTFQKLHRGGFYVQALGSSVVGQIIDSSIFVFLGLGIAFKLPLSAMLINAGSQVLFKLLVETVLFPVTNKLAKVAKKHDADAYVAAERYGIWG